jgi:hypothetical protein
MKAMFPSFILSCALLFTGCNTGVKQQERNLSPKSDKAVNPSKVFYKTSEPNESAFTFLLPEGWTISGGITRVDPNAGGGSGNAIEAKLYMKLNSADQKEGMGWLPDTRFFDMRRYPGQNLAAAMFPDGSNYNGMMVMPLPDPATYIRLVAFPFAHPHAQALAIKQVQALPKLADDFSTLSAQMHGGYRLSYQVAIATLEYTENGIQYLEKMVCTIEDYGQMGGGLWGNKETWYVRAEKPMFESYAPVLATIGHSVKLNTEWLAREIRSQQANSNIALQTQREEARIDSEIAENRSRTNCEINNNMYLNLTGQEDYTNPFTGETERGTNEWNYRWENQQGDVIYTNNQNYSPNEDKYIAVKGFKKSEIRIR